VVEGDEARLFEAMRYSTIGGGKRMRGFLVLEGAKQFGVSRSAALRVASAIEMMHAYSLIHDDLPAMDNDDLRRGKPTNHKAFDEATAILAGDSLQCHAFTVLADRQGGDALYTPNAQLKIYKLVGEFDPREAISHGYIDSQKLFAWQSTAASMADFGGFPSSVIGGTYRENDVTLNTSRRHLIAQSGADRYLVSLFVTTSANQVVATAAATDAIVNGFKVIDPATIPQVPAAAAAPAAPAAGSPAEVPAVASAPVTAAAAPAAAATAPEATAPALEVPTLVAPAPAPAVTAAPTAATPAS
jgi:hypothetical protein